MPQYHTIIFCGPEDMGAEYLAKEHFDKPGVLVIGDGVRDISFDEIRPYKGQIEKNVRISILGHGGRLSGEDGNPYHVLQVSSSKDMVVRDVATSEALRVISEVLGPDSEAVIVNRACYAGQSLEEVANMLPAGVGYFALVNADDRLVEYLGGNPAIMDWVKFPTKEQIAYDLMMQFPIGFGCVMSGEVYRPSPPDKLMPLEEMIEHIDSQLQLMGIRGFDVNRDAAQRYVTNFLIILANHYEDEFPESLFQSIRNVDEHKGLSVDEFSFDHKATPAIVAASKDGGLSWKLFQALARSDPDLMSYVTELIEEGSEEAIRNFRFLIKNGWNYNRRDKEDHTAWHLIAFRGSGRLSMLKMLNEMSVNANTVAKDGTTPLEAFCRTGWRKSGGEGGPEMADILARRANDDQIASVASGSLLRIMRGSFPIFKALIGSGRFDSKMVTEVLLPTAIRDGNEEAAKFLLEGYEIDFNAKNDLGENLLHRAVKFFHGDSLEIAKFLLDRGADINAKNNLGETALHQAIEAERPHKIIKFLLDMGGVDVNAQNELGETPLHFAIKSLNYEIVNYLLGMPGIDLELKSNDGKTAADLAEEMGLSEVSKGIRRAAADFVVRARLRARAKEEGHHLSAKEGSAHHPADLSGKEDNFSGKRDELRPAASREPSHRKRDQHKDRKGRKRGATTAPESGRPSFIPERPEAWPPNPLLKDEVDWLPNDYLQKEHPADPAYRPRTNLRGGRPPEYGPDKKPATPDFSKTPETLSNSPSTPLAVLMAVLLVRPLINLGKAVLQKANGSPLAKAKHREPEKKL